MTQLTSAEEMEWRRCRLISEELGEEEKLRAAKGRQRAALKSRK